MTCYDLVNCATVTISSSQHNKSSMRVPPCTKGVGLTSILNAQLVQRVSSRELAALAGILHPVQGRIEHQILLGLKCDHVHLTCLVSAVKCSQTVEHLGLPMKPTVHADPRQHSGIEAKSRSQRAQFSEGRGGCDQHAIQRILGSNGIWKIPYGLKIFSYTEVSGVRLVTLTSHVDEQQPEFCSHVFMGRLHARLSDSKPFNAE